MSRGKAVGIEFESPSAAGRAAKAGFAGLRTDVQKESNTQLGWVAGLVALARGVQSGPGPGVVHRDIKPANIFVCRYGRDVDVVKVLDFGMVKDTGGGAVSGNGPDR